MSFCCLSDLSPAVGTMQHVSDTTEYLNMIATYRLLSNHDAQEIPYVAALV